MKKNQMMKKKIQKKNILNKKVKLIQKQKNMP